MKQIPSSDSMERISRKELAENLDTVLDRVLREDIGLVISDEGEKDLVLCPASWFGLDSTEGIGSVITCALRYAMHTDDKEGQATLQYLRSHFWALDEKTLSEILTDLEKELEQPESLKNPQSWQELQGLLQQQLDELRKDSSATAEDTHN